MTTTAVVAASAILPARGARADAKFTRHDAASEAGKRMLASYAKGIEVMLSLPPSDPRNWFRTAFTHFLDCPHGNWWFYPWHRGYVGFVEQTVRQLSGDPTFAFPYWDWTANPEMPAEMFKGVLSPAHEAYSAFTKDIKTFTAFIQPSILDYWGKLTPAQRKQLEGRGYSSFESMWNDVDNKLDPGNSAFTETTRARYLTAGNPKLDVRTAGTSLPIVIEAGLAPTQFYNEDITLSFCSSKSPSHAAMPGKDSRFSILEGQPHNKIHNFIGGVGVWDPGPYGWMTNMLSPVDPSFFLHHSNIDRLWDLWTRKQQNLGLPTLPVGDDLKVLSDDPFQFFVRADGSYVLDGKARDHFATEGFDFLYADPVAPLLSKVLASPPRPSFNAAMAHGVADISLPGEESRPVVVALTLARPVEASGAREFDVLVNAPADIKSVRPDSPYYAGTVSFFGPPMTGMTHDATFVVTLPSKFTLQRANRTLKLQFRLVPRQPSKSTTKKVNGAAIQSLQLRRL